MSLPRHMIAACLRLPAAISLLRSTAAELALGDAAAAGSHGSDAPAARIFGTRHGRGRWRKWRQTQPRKDAGAVLMPQRLVRCVAEPMGLSVAMAVGRLQLMHGVWGFLLGWHSEPTDYSKLERYNLKAVTQLCKVQVQEPSRDKNSSTSINRIVRPTLIASSKRCHHCCYISAAAKPDRAVHQSLNSLPEGLVSNRACQMFAPLRRIGCIKDAAAHCKNCCAKLQ